MLDDYLEYRECLHALKGSATELGAIKLVEICTVGESAKPYDIGSDKVIFTCKQIDEVFKNTVAALDDAVTVRQEVFPGKSKEH